MSTSAARMSCLVRTTRIATAIIAVVALPAAAQAAPRTFSVVNATELRTALLSARVGDTVLLAPGTYGDVNLDRFRFTGDFVQGLFLSNADINLPHSNLDVIGMVNDSRLFNNIVVSSPWADINNTSYRTADGPKSRHRGVRHGAHNGRGYPQHRRARPIPGGRRHPRSGRGPSLRRRSAATLTACEAPGQAGGFTPPERPARPPAATADTGGETAPPRAIPPSADRGLPPPQPPPP